MPSTVDGFGTMYFRKRNRRQVDGVCESCHLPVKLENYETWLCFCVLHIPLVPLGKKQILNHCPKCQCHYAVKLADWRRAREEAIEQSSAELAQRPDDPDAAIKMHGTLEAYQQGEEAVRFAEGMLTLFGHVARVQFYLGGWYERVGRKEEADQCFARALALEPNHLPYKRAVALGEIERGNPATARTLLKDFEPPSEAFEPEVFLSLAKAYQRRGRHDQALDVFKLLLEARPALAEKKSFRQAVRISERALHSAVSLVPREPFYRSPLFRTAAAAALIVAALVGGYYHVHSHRVVHFVNGLSVPIVVEVDSGRTVTVGPQSHAELSMAEGPHRAVVREPRLDFEPVDFQLASHWSVGPFSAPAYVVDPTRSAIMLWEEAVYAVRPEEIPPVESQTRWGEAFVAYPHADYGFQAFPDGFTSNASSVRKTRIDLLSVPTPSIVAALIVQPDLAGDALCFIESHLKAAPNDVALLSGYATLAFRQNQAARCRDFFVSRLDERPVLIDWHRTYQTVRENLHEDAEMVEQYGAWLAAEPGNSALLYLRGRCEPDRSAAFALFERAIAADTENAYPQFAESGIFLARGDFAAAKVAAGIACRLRPDNEQMKTHLIQARMALREYDALESELRAVLLDDPMSATGEERLLAVLAAAGKADQARQSIKTFTEQMMKSNPEDEPAWTRYFNNTLLYFQGDFQRLLAATAATGDNDELPLPRYWAQFELRQAVKPPAGYNPIVADHDGYSLLCQALAWAEQGNAAAAAEAKAQAIDQFRAGKREDQRIAEILAKGDDWSEPDVQNLPVNLTHKCIVLVAIAEKSSRRAGPLLDLADKLNFERQFPYHFLKRTIDRLRKRSNAKLANH